MELRGTLIPIIEDRMDGPSEKPQISRRKLLETAGKVLLASSIGNSFIYPFPRKAPAAVSKTTLSYWQPTGFIKEADEEMLRLAQEFSKLSGIVMVVDTINTADLLAKLTVATISGAGPDVARVSGPWPQVNAKALATVDEISVAVDKAEKGFYPQFVSACKVRNEWKAVPFSMIPVAPAYNLDALQKAGARPPETWEEVRNFAPKLKAMGFPLRWNLTKSMVGPAGFAYPLLWSFGAKEVEKDGKTIALDSRETEEAANFLLAVYREASEQGSLTWDDAATNTAFLDQRAWWTVSSPTLYLMARQRKLAVADRMRYIQMPKAKAGVFHRHITQEHVVLAASKNRKPSLEWLQFLMKPENLGRWLKSQSFSHIGPTRVWEENDMWRSDPVVAAYRRIGGLGQEVGYPAPSSSAANEVLTKFIIIDMFAKILQGMGVRDAIRTATNEMKRIYAR